MIRKLLAAFGVGVVTGSILQRLASHEPETREAGESRAGFNDRQLRTVLKHAEFRIHARDLDQSLADEGVQMGDGETRWAA